MDNMKYKYQNNIMPEGIKRGHLAIFSKENKN